MKVKERSHPKEKTQTADADFYADEIKYSDQVNTHLLSLFE